MSQGELILYTTDDGKVSIKLRAEGGTVWLTQAELAELLHTSSQNITLHIKAIYEEGELELKSTCKEYLQVRSEGAREMADAAFLGYIYCNEDPLQRELFLHEIQSMGLCRSPAT